jgi:hypothetical protein
VAGGGLLVTSAAALIFERALLRGAGQQADRPTVATRASTTLKHWLETANRLSLPRAASHTNVSATMGGTYSCLNAGGGDHAHDRPEAAVTHDGGDGAYAPPPSPSPSSSSCSSSSSSGCSSSSSPPPPPSKIPSLR